MERHTHVPVDDRDRCACVTDQCTRVATQEDLLCDECRASCPQGSTS